MKAANDLHTALRPSGIRRALSASVHGQDERVERRVADRRMSNALDVSRLEHENVFRQVQDIMRRLARIELDLRRQDARLESLEHLSNAASANPGRSK